MEPISFRRLTRADFPLLARWLAEPHVSRWWNHEFTDDALDRDFGPSADGQGPDEDYVALLGDRPLGLIQYSRFRAHPDYVAELAPVLDVPEAAVSIDYLIGPPGLTGMGLGTAMIARFVERVWAEEPAVPCVIVPVNSANEASWRALLGAGFRIVARGALEPDNPIDDPLHDILRLDRPSG